MTRAVPDDVVRVILFVSNEYVFESSFIEPVLNLGEKVRLTVVLFGLNWDSALAASLKEAYKAGKIEEFFQVVRPLKNSLTYVPGHQVWPHRLLGQEIVFWRKFVKRFGRGYFHSAILYTEGYFSDFATSYLVGKRNNVLVIHPSMWFPETGMQTTERLRNRLASVKRLLREGKASSAITLVLTSFLARLYRKLVPLLLFILFQFKIRESDIARWGLGSGFFQHYVVLSKESAVRIRSLNPTAEIADFDFEEEEEKWFDASAPGGPLVILGSPGPDLDAQLAVVARELLALFETLKFQSVVIRPHPRFSIDLQKLNHFFGASPYTFTVAGTETPLLALLRSTDVVIGVASSALDQAAQMRPKKFVIGMSAPTRMTTTLVGQSHEEIFWFDSESSDYGEVVNNDPRRNRNVQAPDDDRGTLSFMIRDFVEGNQILGTN